METEGTPRWAVDEMLGRLARYLRFLGHDTTYLTGLGDAEIVQKVRDDGRLLLTRDRELAGRTPGSLLIRSPRIGEQLREVRDAFPTFAYSVAFDRCPECNEVLLGWVHAPGDPWPTELPRERVEAGLPVFRCARCGRRFWDGSHTARIREKVAGWLDSPRP